MRAAVYARFSSENQREQSIEDQVRVCREFAKRNESTVLDAHIYFDEAHSGSLRARPGLEALKKAAEAKPFDCLLVDDSSRLSRDNQHFNTLLCLFQFWGISLISVSDALDMRRGTREGRVPVSRHHQRAVSHGPEEEDPPRADGASPTRLRCGGSRLRVHERAGRRDEGRQEGPSPGRWLQARGRAGGSAGHSAHLPRLHRWEGHHQDREGDERRAGAHAHAAEGRVERVDAFPHSQRREVHGRLHVESHHDRERPHDGPAEAGGEAEGRVGLPGAPGDARFVR